jgi:uncharacterized membrane protein YhaH (DUF805 family)
MTGTGRGGLGAWLVPTGRIRRDWWLLWNLLPGLGWLVLVITVGLLGTQPHPNRYGPPPR